MAIAQLDDRIFETSTVVGTGTATLLGAEIGYRSFSTFADGTLVQYVVEAVDASGVPTGQWEDGFGTVGGGGTTLARTTPKQGSSGPTTLVNFGAGTKQVFVDQISETILQLDPVGTTQVLFNNAGVIGGFGSWSGSILDIDGLYQTVFTDTTTTAGGGFADARVFKGVVTLDPASQPTGTPVRRGLYVSIETASGNPYNFSTLSGGRYDVIHSGDGTVTHLSGFTATVDSYGAGNINDSTAITASAYHDGTGIVTDLVGAWVANVGNYAAGTVTSGAGLRIEAPDNDGGGTFTLYRHIDLLDLAGWGGTTAQAINYANKFVVDIDGKLTVPAAGLTIGANLVTLAGAFTTSGANALTLTTTDATNVTLPTSGTLATTTAPTFTGPVIINEAVGSSGLTITGATQTASFPALNITQEFNNAGVTFIGMDYNLTTNVSAAASRLFRLRVASSEVFSVAPDGTVRANYLTGIGALGLYTTGANPISFLPQGLTSAKWVMESSVGEFYPGGTTNTQDIGHSTGVVRTMNVGTSYLLWGVGHATNYERFGIRVASSVYRLGTANGGSGTARVMTLDYGGTSTAAITVPITSGSITLGGGVLLPDGLSAQFGGVTSSFPALKRSTTILQGRLADDSAFATLQGILKTDTNAITGLAAGVLAALTNASITITDASGQVYRVPVII